MIYKLSPCKVNLLLNILSKRPDGYHELESLMHPVALYDEMEFRVAAISGIELQCNNPELPVGPGNLVYRAADEFLKASGIRDGVRIRLEKRLPVAAGLGGGSANAAITLQALNELFAGVLQPPTLHSIAARIGSDVPFFLQPRPALATGRGEQVQPLAFFSALKSCAILLVHPGFGIPTAWAYQTLARHPRALHGHAGAAQELIDRLRSEDVGSALRLLYNALEFPALEKYPILTLFQEFFRQEKALGTLMSGSGSTTFAITAARDHAESLAERFRGHFGETAWIGIAPLSPD
jgi:4-diphosphocytidyl-2-C-methyl-D-erythritol kinase